MTSVTFYSLLTAIKDLRSLIDIDRFEYRVGNIIKPLLNESIRDNMYICKSAMGDNADKILYIHKMDNDKYLLVFNYSLMINPTIGLSPEEITSLILVALHENLIDGVKRRVANDVMYKVGPGAVLPSDIFREVGDNNRLIGARAIFNYYNTMVDYTSDRQIYFIFDGEDVNMHITLAGIDDLYKHYKNAVYKLSTSLGVDVYTDFTDYYNAIYARINAILRQFKLDFDNSRDNNDDSKFLNELQKYYNSINCEHLKSYLTPHLNRMSKANYAGACIQEAYAIINEGLFDSAIYKKIVKNEADNEIARMIDRISLDIEGIKELDDKYYVTNKIHDQLRICADARRTLLKKYKEPEIRSQLNTISEYEARLNELRVKVVDMQIKKKRYGIFAEVPAGYEG